MEIYKRVNELLGTSYNSNNELDWYWISMSKKLSEDFIKEFKDKVNWYWISRYQKLSEDFIREFSNEVNWSGISRDQKLSENFIREFKDKVNWYWISRYQKLSESFIKEFKDMVDWNWIPKYQKLSENFIREFKDKVDWMRIPLYQKLSPEFIKEFNIEIDPDNWLYKDKEFKKNKIIGTGLYECHKDYFIGYKAIRFDNYSLFNFQYKYEVGEVYKSICDCTNDKDSFGLSIWTLDMAEDYGKDYDMGYKIIKCKINYEDIGRLVHNSNKIRVFKFEVLEELK